MSKRIPWGPGSPGYPNCPVPAGRDVTVWSRDGGQAHDNGPEVWSWDHWGDGSDIIAYCDHDAPDEARELLKEVTKYGVRAPRIVDHPKWDGFREAVLAHKELVARIIAYLERTA